MSYFYYPRLIDFSVKVEAFKIKASSVQLCLTEAWWKVRLVVCFCGITVHNGVLPFAFKCDGCTLE